LITKGSLLLHITCTISVQCNYARWPREEKTMHNCEASWLQYQHCFVTTMARNKKQAVNLRQEWLM